MSKINPMNILHRLKALILTRVRRLKSFKNWGVSQKYELAHAISFMKQDYFRGLHKELLSGRHRVSKGYVSELILKEFFENSNDLWQDFCLHIRNKKVLDIGPCVMSPLASWDICSQRHIIEPLYLQVHDWQLKNLGGSAFQDLICHPQGAEVPVKELLGRVDGAIYCRNMLDHTPNWPFVLSLISLYAAKGCQLLLWTDLDHGGGADEGHYDITTDSEAFKRLIISLGFRVCREFSDTNRIDKNWGCFAIKG